jgi:hypothetical protein
MLAPDSNIRGLPISVSAWLHSRCPNAACHASSVLGLTLYRPGPFKHRHPLRLSS